MRTIFIIAPGQQLILTGEAVCQMRAHTQHTAREPESGGILLGRHLLDSQDLVVDEVTVPQKEDRQSRFTFFRSKRHSMLAHQRWEATNGRVAYLGLWHTHPELDPVPSCVDRQDWTKAIARDAFEGERLFFPIVGIDRIRVWTKTRIGAIEELHEQGT